MRCSYNWLKEFAFDLPPAPELADRLTMTGTEVEGVEDLSGGIKGVVTAEVLNVDKHPNADKLKLCGVRTDSAEFSIVCGASNMKAGDRVALALHGASLPNGLKIKKSKIRGVESQGMMCSEVELGLADESTGIMILPGDTPLGVDIVEALGLKDYILDVGVTPNRADLLSIRGLAREAGAVTGAAFRDKVYTLDEGGAKGKGPASVNIQDGAPCGRYTASVISGVKVGPSPERIVRRLEAHGIRPVNNVVDITNYVLLEFGTPLHAFDLDKVKGMAITVRQAEKGEEIETIDNKTRTLSEDMLVIADGTGPVAVAGVMGGVRSEVTDSTVNVLLESAWFEPSSVRRTSRALGLSSESSYRFERGVDIESVPVALKAAASLIIETAGGELTQTGIDEYPGRHKPSAVSFRTQRAGKLLGVELDPVEVSGYFKKLGMGVKGPDADGVIEVAPPSYRMDITSEVDLLEEVARLFGYDRINTTLPEATLSPGLEGRFSELKRKVTGVLAGNGLIEVINYSFISRKAFGSTGRKYDKGVEILNPLSEDQAVMRRSLIPSLVENLRYNISRKNADVRIFEIAPIFIPEDDQESKPEEGRLPLEKWKVSGLLYGTRWGRSWNLPAEEVDFFDAKGVVERLVNGLGGRAPMKTAPAGGETTGRVFHPGKAATVSIAGRQAGVIGELHPDLLTFFDIPRPACVFELDLEILASATGAVRRYRSLPRFPESTRDVAFIVGTEIPYGEILTAIEKLDAKLIEKVELFDVYYGRKIPAGKRSMALRVRYRSKDRTLLQAEVDDIHSKVISELTSRFSAEVRGEPQNL